MSPLNNPLTVSCLVFGIGLQIGAVGYLVLAGNANMVGVVTALFLGGLIEGGGVIWAVLKTRS